MKKLFALLIAMLLPCVALADPFDREVAEIAFNDLAENYYHFPTLPEPEIKEDGYIYRADGYTISVQLAGDDLRSILLIYNVPITKDMAFKMRDLSSCVLGIFADQSIERFYDAFSTYVLYGEKYYSDHEKGFAVQLQKAENGGQVFYYVSLDYLNKR